MTAAGGSSAMDDATTFAWHFACVWLVGLVLGWLLPKPKWVDRSLKAKALLLATPPGLWFRRVALAAQLSLIVREVWRNLFAPGTFRGVMRNGWLTLSTGARFQWPAPAPSCVLDAPPSGSAASTAAEEQDSWYVGEQDLAEFKAAVARQDWEPMMEKQWPGCTYTAWRRTLPSGKSEYKSITISEDATAEEFMDFYLDDEARMQWDGMISETELLESGGDPAARRQVVRWLRTFPFAFLNQREYVIARRSFREPDGSLYAVTRGLVAHPAAPVVPGRVRMEGFHSHWRSRTVPCPHGSVRPAVETTLLHFEDFQINERLARFAVRHGMAGFVKGMIPAVQRFVAERRQRCDPNEADPASFGCRQLAPRAALPPLGLDRAASGLSSASSDVGSYSLEDSASERSARAVPRSASMRRLGAMMLASGVAIALARTTSCGTLAPPTPGPSARPAGGSSKRHVADPQHSKPHSQRQHHGRRHNGAGKSRRRQHAAASSEPAVLAVMAQQ